MPENPMKTTLKDIAKHLNLSVTTVSRALAGYSDVAESTRQRVMQAAEEMGYVPNATARRLQKGRTDTIGLIVPTYRSRFSDPFFAEFLAGIGNLIVQYEFDLLVSTRPPGNDELEAYQRMVTERRVDGLIIMTTRPQDERIAYLLKSGFPFVSFGRSDLEPEFPYLDVDGEHGMQTLTQHMIDLGHQRIAYISAPYNVMYAMHRLEGYKKALAENNIPFDKSLVSIGDLTKDDGQKIGKSLLDHENGPTAIICCNDWMASGVISAARKLNIHVGKDVAIAGFDDIPLAEFTHPPLTTIRQPAYQAGVRVSEMLIRLIHGEELAQRHILLQPDLVIRESTGPIET